MSKKTTVDQIFTVLDDTATAIQEELMCSYLEAVAETGENLFQDSILQEELSELTQKRLEKEYKKIVIEALPKETIRKAFQLAVLKGMREATQPHHQMTPDTVGLFAGYLASKLLGNKPAATVLDPAVGSGNLLMAVLNQLGKVKTDSIGIDVDDLLIKLAYVSANLQQHPIRLYNQDSLETLFIEPADLAVCDLPIGYYPNDDNAANFNLRAETGHSFAHHLFIEQSIRHVKDGGYLIFLIPNNLFEGPAAQKLHDYIKETSFIQGLLQLPVSMFKNEQSAKSLFILQKKGAGAEMPKQALLANLPSFSNREAMQRMIVQIDEWFRSEKGINSVRK